MGRVIINTAMTVNGAFDSPAPDTWLVVDADSGDDGLDLLMLGEALLLGRKTYEGLAAVWPDLTEDPELGRFAGRINSMPKYVVSRTLSGPLEWNSTVLDGDLETAVDTLKSEHNGDIVVSGTGELAHGLATAGLVDEYWVWVHPFLWADGPRVFEGVGPIKLELAAATSYGSGVVCLRYRPARATT